ncbi:hypothetical protein JOD02_001997 [Caldicoprobacter guelmensis]|uniref:DUF2933 domain-containing protein n=1 Tax=Caldicoprobacter guelmensis TaxID=1170224 RepID=UPI00195802C6|nr:DUF2933 domain-containing protein [Caldicoprobacter guelmensis]MBM7583120.1 hypothetical protein [Caldicoprobacter guelmensis]
MNCHGGHGSVGNENGHGTIGHKLHKLVMILCCVLPVTVILALYLLKINNTILRDILSYGAILLCPLMHILMIPMMLKKDRK